MSASPGVKDAFMWMPASPRHFVRLLRDRAARPLARGLLRLHLAVLAFWRALRHARARPDQQSAPAAAWLETAAWLRSRKARRSGARSQIVAAPMPPVRRLATDLGEPGARPRLMQRSTGVGALPAVHVVTLPGARVLGREGDVITADGVFLRDVGYNTGLLHERHAHPALRGGVPRAAQHLPGRTALLASLFAGSNYFHWLFNLLPRIEALRLAGHPPREFDHVIVCASPHAYAPETLALLGILPERVVWAENDSAFTTQTLVTTTSLRRGGHFSPWACSFVRRLVLDSLPSPGPAVRRLYVGRGDVAQRRVSNEPELIDWLAGYGFESVQPAALSVAQQAALFAEAAVVIAPHGAALANLVFCPPGARVVELQTPRWARTYYWELSACMGLDYHYLWGQSTPGTLDYNVPIERLAANIDRLFGAG